ncbi:hypothetical protein [Pseudomonas fluorescens]|uniref:hypothetical protein n=1 Tax=Pseudomonas fluorescens TaxID=294 RepID=UPI0010CEA56C|nr:hypothetical protein [Pseudomonas fluorescens]TCV62708.1 hypothetical protein EDB98_11216 [Pseudomonas fluorescens]
MSDATYRIKARKNINGKPLLIVTFNVDYEVLLDQERFEQLSSTVVKYSDGVEGEKLTSEEFRLWGDELKRMWAFRNSMGELPPYAQMELETKPSVIPRALLHSILTSYEETTKQPVNIFVSGQAPNFSLNINWGTVTYSAVVPANQAKATLGALTELNAKAEQCLAEGKSKDETKKLLLETGAAILGAGQATKDVVDCTIAIAVACEFPGAIPAVIFECKEAYDSIADLLEAFEKEKRAKEQAEREQHQQQVEANIERISHCRELRESGIQKSRDIDGAMIGMRTA